jgi:hypothetical protein
MCKHGLFTSRTYSLSNIYFASKSFAAVREALAMRILPDKEVPNKTTIHRLVTFRNTEVFATGHMSGVRQCWQARHPATPHREHKCFNYKSSLVTAMLGLAFGRRDLHPLPRQTAFSFPWGFLKERLYSNHPRSLEEMKHNNEQTVASTDPETISKFALNILNRVDACLREGSGHFQHLLQSCSIRSSWQKVKKKRIICLVIVTSPKLTNRLAVEVRVAFWIEHPVVYWPKFINSLDYGASGRMVVNDKFGRRRSWPSLTQFPSICLGAL